jgi:hypothetical protein
VGFFNKGKVMSILAPFENDFEVGYTIIEDGIWAFP